MNAAHGGQGTSRPEGLQLVPMTLEEAQLFVSMWHRHHEPPIGHKFSIGVADGTLLVGVAMIGRPVARHLQDGRTLEVNRTCTDGARNANSMLYAAGLITYTQHRESGSSLLGAGWRVVAERPARPGWDMPSRPRDDRGTAEIPRTLWEAA